jgi:hypothetical protein
MRRMNLSRLISVSRMLWSGLAGILIFSLFPDSAFSQGCPPAHLMSCPLGDQSRTYLERREWLMTISYRHYHAFRDYRGDDPLPVPSPPEIFADTRMNILDYTLTYALSKRWSVSLEFPFQWASRETYLEHDGISPHTMHSTGFGDVRVIGNIWLMDPEKHKDENVSVKLGLKTPAGNRAVQDYSFREDGPVLRPVDPAIQPASGGWGVIFGALGFKSIFRDTFVYFDGVYLANPREMNGTPSPFGDRPEITGGDIGYIIDSVPDLYLARVGLSHSFWPSKGISGTFGLRTDGVPARDLFGGSDGYRLPGYTVSIEPGVSFTRGRNFFSLTVPVAVKGHGSKSVADERTGSPFAGIVTLADSQLVLSYSRRF